MTQRATWLVYLTTPATPSNKKRLNKPKTVLANMKKLTLITMSLLCGVTMLAALPTASAHPADWKCHTRMEEPSPGVRYVSPINPYYTTEYTSSKFNHEYDGNGLLSTAVMVTIPCGFAGPLAPLVRATSDTANDLYKAETGICTYSYSTGPQAEDCDGHKYQIGTPLGDSVPVLCLYDSGFYDEEEVCGHTGSGNYIAVAHTVQSSTM